MSSNQRVTTNFIRSNGVDVAYEFITKDYLLSVYPGISQEIGKIPELWVWGNPVSGKLGDAQTSTSKSTPITTFAGGTNWKQASAGDSHTAAIKTDGTLWVWGLGTIGQLGNATIVSASTPVTVFGGGTNWKQVSVGDRHTAAIKTDGTLWLWGSNSYGRLGNFSTVNTSTPVTVFGGGTNWKQVSVGFRQTSAIKTDGTLWIWGDSGSGEMGNGNLFSRCTPVTTFAGGTNWKQTSSTGSYTAAIKTDGTLWVWGFNGSGRLGNFSTTNVSTPVTTFAGGNNWKQVSSNSTTAAIKTDGTLWTWGAGGSLGNLGNNAATDRSTPVTTFAGGTNWKQVSSGDALAAIKTDGTLWTWGDGSSGRLGNAQTTNSLTPVTTFAGGNNWKQVSVDVHMLAIESADFI